MTVGQAAFHAALLDPDRPVPDGLVDPAGRPAGARFDVYRNNVVASLVAALGEAFPTVQAVVGAGNFDLLARAYVRAHPPATPLMMYFGGEMPAFLTHFAPVQPLGYLPDVARLEIAIRESYHAADAAPLDPSALGALSPERLTAARLRLAPALRLVHTHWPIVSIRAHSLEDGPKPQMQAECALITRPGFDPVMTAVTPAAAACIDALASGATLGEAQEAGLAESATFDLSAPLGPLLAGGAIIGLDED